MQTEFELVFFTVSGLDLYYIIPVKSTELYFSGIIGGGSALGFPFFVYQFFQPIVTRFRLAVFI